MGSVEFQKLFSAPVRNGLYKSKEFQGHGVRLVKMNQLFGERRIRASADGYDRIALSEQEKQTLLLTKNDLLFSRTSVVADGVGKCSLIVEDGEELTWDSNIIRVRLDPNLACPEFYFYFFNSPQGRDTVKKLSSGAAVTTITGSGLAASSVPAPPLASQRRIAGILSAYDDLIENNQRRIKILEEMARSLYREWFVNFRFPGHEKVPLVDSALGDVPTGWEVVSLEDVCECVTDGSHYSPKSVEEGLPMASSKDMHDWGLNLDTCRFIGREDFDQLVRNGCKPKRHDVLITKDGANYLKYIFVNRTEQELVILSSIAILRPNPEINPHLLAAILKSPENKGRLKNYVTGAAIPRIVLKDFKRFQFVLPSKAVQAQWAKIAEPTAGLCWQLVDQIQNLRRTRDLLLPRLLNGSEPVFGGCS